MAAIPASFTRAAVELLNTIRSIPPGSTTPGKCWDDTDQSRQELFDLGNDLGWLQDKTLPAHIVGSIGKLRGYTQRPLKAGDWPRVNDIEQWLVRVIPSGKMPPAKAKPAAKAVKRVTHGAIVAAYALGAYEQKPITWPKLHELASIRFPDDVQDDAKSFEATTRRWWRKWGFEK